MGAAICFRALCVPVSGEIDAGAGLGAGETREIGKQFVTRLVIAPVAAGGIEIELTAPCLLIMILLPSGNSRVRISPAFSKSMSTPQFSTAFSICRSVVVT